jgi:hypothetical protein
MEKQMLTMEKLEAVSAITPSQEQAIKKPSPYLTFYFITY